MLSKIYNLLRYCYQDSITDKFAGIEFQLFILSVKSLLPYEDRVGCMFDTERYIKEIELFSYYKNGIDHTVDFYLKNKGKTNVEDKLLEYKIIPLSISNTDYSMLIDEVMKIVMLFTSNNETIIDAIVVSSAVYEYLNKEIIDIEDMKNKIKERLIEFSLKDYFEKNNNVELDKSYIIDFEKQRIQTIIQQNYFNEEKLMKYKSLQFINSNLHITKTIDKGNETLLDNFSSYLLKIRKGTLNPEKLRYTQGKIPNLVEYLKKDEFVHPLLGKCFVLSRSEREIILKNKLGLLRINI